MKTTPSSNARIRSKKGSCQAFTLIEVMMAISVILVTYLTIFGGMTMSLTVTELTRENLRATQIMLDKMEGLRLYSWAQLTNTTGSSPFLMTNFTNWFYETNNIGEINASGNGVMYTGTVQVVSVPFTNSYSSTMKQVNVNLGWTSDAAGVGGQTRTMTTFYSEYGMQNYVYNH